MKPATCPTSTDLSSLLLGKLTASAAQNIEQHVETCHNCQHTLRAVDPRGDWLEEGVQAANKVDAGLETGCQEAITRIRSYAPAATEVTIGPSATTGAVPRNEELDPPVHALGAIREYKLLAKLGEGGMGAVYKAQHTKLRRTVALKVLPQAIANSPGVVARFEREMQAVGALDHPNIVRAFDAGESDGRHYLVMEYVKGRDLSQLARDCGQLSIADACELVRQAAVGLEHAHESGLVHRDIKPSNLMLTETGVVKILDLGLALLSNAEGAGELTSTGQVMGTIDYMAPEQGGDTHHVDIRADIYSLGATLYRLLSGIAPFDDPKFDTPVKKLMALATQEPTPVEQRRPEIPSALAAVVTKMLAKSPDKRSATPAEVARALAPFTVGANLPQLAARGAGVVAAPVTGESETQANLKSASADTLAPALKPSSQGGSAWSRFQQLPLAVRWLALTVLALVGSGAAAWALSGIVLFWETPNGTVRIQIDDPAIVAQFNESELTVTGADKQPITIRAAGDPPDKSGRAIEEGQHQLLIKRDGLEFLTDNFELKKAGKTTLKISLVAGKVQVTANGTALGVAPKSAASSPAISAAPGAEHALLFDSAQSQVEAEIKLDETNEFTLETWVRASELPNSKQSHTPVACLFDDNAHLKRHHLESSDQPDRWAFVVRAEDGKYRTITDSGPVRIGEWYHLAAVGDKDELRLFVNGRLLGYVARPVIAAGNRKQLRLGGTFHTLPEAFVGEQRETRVSSFARYQKSFVPATRFEVDAQTVALYHFDEGAGDSLKDSSGNNHHGKIVGAKWVKVDDSTIEATAPSPAVAPLDAAQAKAHQAAWAKHLGVPVEREIALPGDTKLTLVLVPPGQFRMGSGEAEQSRFEERARVVKDQFAINLIATEGPQHLVNLTEAFYLGRCEMTQAQWQAVMGENPAEFQENAECPVEKVSWDEVQVALKRLNEQHAPSGLTFVLPTEAQWEYACRAGTSTYWHSGDREAALDEYGWTFANAQVKSHPVAQLAPNAWGLYDMHGNVWEWCSDSHSASYYQKSPADDPPGPPAGLGPVLRGGSWRSFPVFGRSAYRYFHQPSDRKSWIGFRLAAKLTALPTTAAGSESPPRAVAPFNAAQAKAHQVAWAEHLGVPVEHTNSIGMKFRMIPPGEFMMGSTQAEIDALLKTLPESDSYAKACLASEGPQHKVILTKPFYLAVNEVTQEQYEKVQGVNPAFFARDGINKELAERVAQLDTTRHPVERVNWSEAEAFTQELGNGYRLPTEAEWEFACRAGSTTRFSHGEQEDGLSVVAWWKNNSGNRTHPVGELQANPFGLHDTTGGVWEWVSDCYDPGYFASLAPAPAMDPQGPALNDRRVIRGGSWWNPAILCRAGSRVGAIPTDRVFDVGIRVALSVDAVRSELSETSAVPPAAIAPF